MTSGPWVDRAWVGVLPDLGRFGPELDRGITKALNDVERHVNQAGGRVTRRFQDMARDAGRALDGIGSGDTFTRLETQAERAARGIEGAFTGVGDRAFDGLQADANRAAEGIEDEFQQAERGADRALRGIGGPGQFRDVEGQADRAADRIHHSFLRARTSASFSLGALTTHASVAGGLISAALGTIGTAAVTMGLQSAAAMEQAQISFAQLLGSGRKAKDFLADLNQFAATTPFELPGLIEASRSLLGAGQAAKDIIPIMTALGDATGALGLSQDAFGRIMLATTQAMNKGRLQGEELMQMQEAGLPVTAMLAKALGVTTKRVSELSQAGKLQSDEVLPKLFDQMHKDYGGSMIKQSHTLNGLWSTFMDTTRNALRKGIEPLLPAIKDALPEAARILEGAIRNVVSFFRDDLGPELGRIKLAWEENGTAILGLFTSMASGRGEMDASKTAAQSLADSLVALTNALGDVSRFANQLGLGLNIVDETLDRWGSSIHENVVAPLNTAVKETGEWIGVNQVVGLVARDVSADLRDLGITFGHNSAATDDGTTASERHAAALRDEARASRALKAALDDEHDADLSVRQSKLDVSRAQAHLTELRKDGKRKSFEYRQAELDLEVAQNRLRDSNAKLREATNRSSEAERVAASASTRAAGAHDKFAGAAHDAGRMGLKFGDNVRDGILRIPKGRTIKIEADFGWQGLQVFRTPGGKLALKEGGLITEGTGPTADDVPAWVSKHEAVVPARATSDPWFQAWAKHQRIPGFAQGGIPAGGIGLDFKTFPISRLNRRIDEFEGGINQVLDLATARFKRLAERSAVTLTGGTGAGFGSGSWMRAIAELRADHVPYHIISTFRRGAVTHASGRQSYHALNRAVDLTGPSLINIWRSLTDTNPTELIYAYAPMYKSRSGWHPIGRLDRVTWNDHKTHVHAAYDRGGYLRPGLNPPSWNGTGQRERVLDPAETRIWEQLERRLAAAGGGRPRRAAPQAVNVQQGAVQIVIQGSVDRRLLPDLQASVEDGLHAVLRELRTGSAA